MGRLTFGAAVAALSLAAGAAAADDRASEHPALRDRFYFGAGVFLPQTATSAQLQNSRTGVGANVDFENALGMATDKSVPIALARWRINELWRIEAEYFQLNRSAQKVIDRDIQWGDTVYPVNAQLDSAFDFSDLRTPLSGDITPADMLRWREVRHAGHELGNHSWMHSYFQNFYRTDQQQSDVERSTRLIQELSGSDAEPLYRPPVGLKSPPLARVAHARKLKVIAWSLHSRDTLARDANATAARVLSRITPGDIVLMHDGHERDGKHRRLAAAALPLILRGLHERGLASVTVSELLRA
jgi:peptidoglycan/xylan/chitin deacetylase (PgdA/CDA1 family)